MPSTSDTDTDLGEKDIVDDALAQAIREGRVVVTKDEEGRKVYRAVKGS